MSGSLLGGVLCTRGPGESAERADVSGNLPEHIKTSNEVKGKENILFRRKREEDILARGSLTDNPADRRGYFTGIQRSVADV